MNELGNTPADKNYKPSGISRAEERALEAYPVVNTWSPYGPLPVDQNKLSREKYQEGYEQAEKDVKEALLEWAKEHQEKERQNSLTWACYQIFIDEINSL